MIRVLNELIPSVRKLNDLHRSGFSQQVEQGLVILIGAIERGEMIGDSPILQKLEAIEQRLSNDVISACKKVDVQKTHVSQRSVVVVPKPLPSPEPQILTEAELLDRFNLSPNWRSSAPHGWVHEFWLAQKLGVEYLGNDRYQLWDSP